MNRKNHLIIIDPQIDFCIRGKALYVEGADGDMQRLAVMLNRAGGRLDAIHVTLDSHHYLDIAHPAFWKDSDGNPPAPFTIISVEDVASGKYRSFHPGALQRATEYIAKLAANGRYPLCIWPPHCLIGSEGHGVHPELFRELLSWEAKRPAIRPAMVDYLVKGANPYTEHYSALMADVPDPEDPTTQLNTGLIRTLQTADLIGIAGEALSHCVANTIRDIADNFGEENIAKFVLLKDACSSVPSFEHLGEQFVADMTARGMKVATCAEFLA